MVSEYFVDVKEKLCMLTPGDMKEYSKAVSIR
jgi:hypothetical protein